MPEVPGHKDIDEGALRSRIGPWLRTRLEADELEMTGVHAPEGQGFSSETVVLGVTWRRGSDEAIARYVLKARPTGETVFPVYDLEAQFRCMQLVRAHSEVPAAPARWYEPDESLLGRPFYVMDHVEGEVPPDNLPYTLEGFVLDSSPGDQRRLYEGTLAVLAGLHRLDWRSCGFGFLDRPQHGPTGLQQQLGEGAHYLEWVAQGRPQPVPEAALDRLRRTLPTDPPPTGLSWGDSRIGNVIYQDYVPAAVLDWEMAALAPAEVDLAWFLYMHRFFTVGLGVPDLPGFPTEVEAVAHYERLLGRSVHDLDWYLLWAGFRYGVVMVRIAQKMAAAGVAGAMTEHDNLAVDLLSTFL